MGHHPYFFAGRERELRDLVHRADRRPIYRELRDAACRGMDPTSFIQTTASQTNWSSPAAPGAQHA